jgi:hypothetical protein
LQDGARGSRGERVKKPVVRKSFADKALKDIRNNNEEIRGERIALPEAVAASNPVARHPVKEHSSVTCR